MTPNPIYKSSYSQSFIGRIHNPAFNRTHATALAAENNSNAYRKVANGTGILNGYYYFHTLKRSTSNQIIGVTYEKYTKAFNK